MTKMDTIYIYICIQENDQIAKENDKDKYKHDKKINDKWWNKLTKEIVKLDKNIRKWQKQDSTI